MSVWIGRYNVFLAWLRVNSRVRLGVVCGCLAVLCFVMSFPMLVALVPVPVYYYHGENRMIRG